MANDRLSANNSFKKKGRGRPKKLKRLVKPSTGRKRVSTMEASRSTKYRRALELLESVDNDVSFLEYAAKIGRKRRNCGNDLTENHDTENNIKPHLNETALAFYLENDYNKDKYKKLFSDTRNRNVPIYPEYRNVRLAMVECEPKNYNVSEVEVVVSLQQMLNKTVERLCSTVAIEWNEQYLHNLQLYVTLGFDSSSGHVNPHQKYDDIANESKNTQNSLFVTSFIVIQLKNDNGECSWINPTPQSIRFCGPVRIALEKEDDLATLKEYNRLNEEIRELLKHRFNMINGKHVRVKFNVSMTLFDGKCVNTITGNKATSRCPMCNRTAHMFGNLEDDFTPNESSLKLGLGLLHCEIKAFEHLLHIAYRTTVFTWDVKENIKDKVNEQKKIIQDRIYAEFAIRPDQVLATHGTTNTGNLARKCFENPRKFADSLKIHEQLVINIALVIQLLRSKMNLNLEKFETLCWETYKMHYELYSWARMNPSLHKLLKHSSSIIRQFPLPIAYFSEDANESWHKLYRKNMINHSRQVNRKSRILDVFNRAVYLTDPKISLIYIEKRLKIKKKRVITTEMEKYLIQSTNDDMLSDESSYGTNDIDIDDTDSINDDSDMSD